MRLEAADSAVLDAFMRACRGFMQTLAVVNTREKPVAKVQSRDFTILVTALRHSVDITDQVFLGVVETRNDLQINLSLKSISSSTPIVEQWARSFKLDIKKDKKVGPVELWNGLWPKDFSTDKVPNTNRYFYAKKVWEELQKRFPELLRKQEFPDLTYFTKYGYFN